MAPRIELRTRVLVRGVQSNDFMAHEVVAWCDALWDSVCDGAAGDLEGVGAPDVRGALAAVFLDFEPDCTGGGVNIKVVDNKSGGLLTLTQASSHCIRHRGTWPCM